MKTDMRIFVLLNLQTIYDVCIYASRAKEELRDGGVDVTLGCSGMLFLWVFCGERRLSKGAEELFTVNSRNARPQSRIDP